MSTKNGAHKKLTQTFFLFIKFIKCPWELDNSEIIRNYDGDRGFGRATTIALPRGKFRVIRFKHTMSYMENISFIL